MQIECSDGRALTTIKHRSAICVSQAHIEKHSSYHVHSNNPCCDARNLRMDILSSNRDADLDRLYSTYALPGGSC